jgi:multiple sugar transport system substrate-binding protein
MKRWLINLWFIVIATVTAQGFLPEIPEEQTVEITFYSYNLASAGIGAEGTQQIMDEFMAQYPNIRVTGVGIPSPDIIARVQSDLVAGIVPDVAQLIFDDLDFIANNFGLTPLDDLVAPEELSAHFEGFNPRGLELGRYDGKIYGLPYVFSTPILFYNADVFRAAGLDPDVPPTTWEDVKDYALQITEATNNWGIYVGVYGTFDWMFQSLVLSNGGRVLSEDRTQLMFGDTEAIGVVEMLRDLVVSGAHPDVSGADATDAMTSGRLGMFLNTSAFQNFLINAATGNYELRTAKMPAFGNQPIRPVNSGSALFILSRDPLKQRAAWEFMKFATGRRGYTIITSKIGYLPLRPDIVTDPEYLQPWVESNPLILPNLEQLESISPWVAMPGPSYKQIVAIMMNALETAVFGENSDTESIMRDAQVRAQALIP